MICVVYMAQVLNALFLPIHCRSQKVGNVAVALSLATGDGGNNKIQAVLTRSSSNCIMVDLKPECLIVNHCPMQVVVTLGGDPLQEQNDPLQEHSDTSFQLMAGQAEVLTEKEVWPQPIPGVMCSLLSAL